MAVDISIFGAGPFVDGEEYTATDGTVYTYSNGCFVIPVPADVDTVDGYALQGVSDGSALDADGNIIAAGSPIINFYDASGLLLNSKDCTDLDTNDFGILVTASADGIDDAGNAYSNGDNLIQLADGSLICAEKTIDTDTFAELIIAGADGTDDAGNDYIAGDSLIQLAGGDLVCASKTIDTDTVDGYAVQGVSDGSQLDAQGNPIPANAEIITFYDSDGNVINSKDCTDVDTNDFAILAVATEAGIDDAGNPYEAGDSLLQIVGGQVLCQQKSEDTDTFSELIVAGESGTDDAGNDYLAGDYLIQLVGGDLVCASKTIDTDTVDGYAVQGISDGSQLDQNGEPIPADAEIITFYDANGNVINSKDCTDVDTNDFAILSVATEDGTDDAGNDYAAGDALLQTVGGEVLCQKKTEDTFSQLIIAGEAGTDDAGNAYNAGDALIELPGGDLVCATKPVLEVVKNLDDLTCGRVGSIDGCDLWDQPLPIAQGCVAATASGEDGIDQLTITESSYGTHVGQTVDTVVADILFADGSTIAAQALTAGGDTVVALDPAQIALLNHPIKITITATDCNGQVSTGIAA